MPQVIWGEGEPAVTKFLELPQVSNEIFSWKDFSNIQSNEIFQWTKIIWRLKISTQYWPTLQHTTDFLSSVPPHRPLVELPFLPKYQRKGGFLSFFVQSKRGRFYHLLSLIILAWAATPAQSVRATVEPSHVCFPIIWNGMINDMECIGFHILLQTCFIGKLPW